MNRAARWAESTLRRVSRLLGVPCLVSVLVGASVSAGTREPAAPTAVAAPRAGYVEPLVGDPVSLVGLALIGVIAISRRHKAR